MQTIIELNAHMVRTNLSIFLIEFGALGASTALVIACRVIWRMLSNQASLGAGLIFCAIVFVIMGAMVVWGLSIPRVKEIQFCVNGPITIERIESVYDIQEIDGKLLTVRERT